MCLLAERDSIPVERMELSGHVGVNAVLTQTGLLPTLNHHGLSRFLVNESKHVMIDVQ